MRRDTRTNTFNSSFMSCEKDIETILKKLFEGRLYKIRAKNTI